MEHLVAVVSGAGHPQGIGRAIADGLSGAGATVVATDLPDADGFAGLDDKYHAQPCDVTQQESVAGLMRSVIEEFGRIDILVNNAGVALGAADFLSSTPTDWQLSLAVNVMGTVNMCQAVLPHLGSGGSIINVASLAGLGAIDSIPACYTASKFAVVGLTKQIAQEFAAQGVRCNVICPGSIKTQMHAKTLALIAEEHGVDLDAAQQMENESIPMGYSAAPSTIGDIAVFLASPASSYMTGVALPVAGGMAAGL